MTTLSEQTFDNGLDAQILARKLACAECEGAVEPHFRWTKETGTVHFVWCVSSRGKHALRKKGPSAVGHYLATGEGTAITRMQAERWLEKKLKKEEEAMMTSEATGTAIQKEGADTLKALLARDDTREAIATALPRHMDMERFIRFAITAVGRTPALAECTPKSFAGALLQAASVGLEPETPLQHAHLIPFKNHGVMECTLVLGYRGLVDLARRSGQITTVYAEVVYRGDAFEQEMGLEPTIRHKRKAEPITKQVGDRLLFTGENVTHAYAVAKFANGDHQFVVLDRKTLDSIRSQSKASTSGPWMTHPEEMDKKSALRRLCKLLPMSSDVRAVLDSEDGQTVQILDTTSQLVGVADSSEPTAPPEPLPDCPLHEYPWTQGDQGGLYHSTGQGHPSCTASKMLTAVAADKKGMEKADLDTYLKATFALTASKLTAEQVTAAYNALAGIVGTDGAPVEDAAEQPTDAFGTDEPETVDTLRQAMAMTWPLLTERIKELYDDKVFTELDGLQVEDLLVRMRAWLAHPDADWKTGEIAYQQAI